MTKKTPTIIQEDRDVIVCVKPSGMAVQTGKMAEPDLISWLKNYLRSQYLGVVHRLDQPVEGLLVFAKNKQAAAELSRQNEEGEMNKCYTAVVFGSCPDQLTLCDYLVRNPKDNSSRISSREEPGAKKSELAFRKLGEKSVPGAGTASLIEIKLITGRHHQIRVQLAGAGFPLLGDFKYGSEESRKASEVLEVKSVALCASQITFRHPYNKKTMEFSVKPEAEIFASLMEDITN